MARHVTALAANPSVLVWIAASYLAVLLSHCSREGKPVSQMKRSKLAVTEAAERLRAGESLDAVAADADITRHTLVDRLSKAGFSGNGENNSVEQRHELKSYLSSALLTWLEPWMSEAICAQTDPDAFFPEKGGSTKEAKRVCLGCPVRETCLEWALVRRERFGIYGGKSERERRAIAKQRKAAA